MNTPLRNTPVSGPRFRLIPWRDRLKAAPPPPPVPSLADDKPPLGDLRRALDDGAKQVRTTFIWFITISTYFAVLVGTTTHEQLFLGQSIKIPVVDVTLPIDAVYLVAPIVYFVIYVGILVQADGLGQVLERFQVALDALPPERRRHEMTTTTDLPLVNLYLRTSSSRIVTFLTWSTFVFAFFAVPLVIMLLFQVNFLPYKHTWLTYWHICLVAMTTVLSIYFWFRFAPALRPRGRSTLFGNALLVILPLIGTSFAVLSTLIFVPERSWIEANIGTATLADIRSVVVRNLNLRGQAIGDGAKVISILNRDLSNADFSGARLNNVEFINSALHGTQFQQAVLRNVRYICKEDSYDEVDDADCQVDALDMSGATLLAVRMEGLSIGYLNLRSAIIAKSRLNVDVRVTNLGGSKVWESTLGYVDSTSDKVNREIGWTYVGSAMMRDSTLYVGAVSGVHDLALAIRTTFTTDSADPVPVRAPKSPVKVERPAGPRLIIVEYFGDGDVPSGQRRWNRAFEPHETTAMLGGDFTGRIKADGLACTPGPTTPASLAGCMGRTGYKIHDRQNFTPQDVASLIEVAESACSDATPGPVLLTSVTSFLRPALMEQVTGRNLILLSRLSVPTRKQPKETDEQFERRQRASLQRLGDQLSGREAQIAELSEIWSTLSKSACLCGKLTGSEFSAVRRVATTLSAFNNRASPDKIETFCAPASPNR